MLVSRSRHVSAGGGILARDFARTYLPPPSDFDLACYYCCSRRSVVIMLLLLMAWPSRTSWSAWKFPQRCSPHRPDPRESATSRAEPVFLLVPGTHSSIDNQLSLLSFSARRAIAMPLSYVVEAFGRTGAELRVARGVHTTSLQLEHLLVWASSCLDTRRQRWRRQTGALSKFGSHSYWHRGCCLAP